MGKTKTLELTWAGEETFRGGVPGGPQVVLDGHAKEGVSPVEQLLLAAASCSGIDVVLILQKMRVALEQVRVEVSGERRDETPRRFTAIHFRFHAAGDGADEAKLRRAVELSLQKYCSVVTSLAPDIRITYDAVVG